MHSTHTHTHTHAHTHKRTNTNTNEFWKLISMISEEPVRDDCINYCNVQLLKWFHLFCLFVTRASVAFRVIDWFCWHTTKLSLTKLVVFVIDWLIRRFIISFYNPCDSGLENSLGYIKDLYSINYTTKLTFYHFQKLIFVHNLKA